MNIKSILVISLLMASLLLASAPMLLGLEATIASSSPTVWTDKEDYAPGETVLIYGSGFQAETSLIVQILRPKGTDWLVVSTDASGSFMIRYKLTPEKAMSGVYEVIVIDPIMNQVRS
jgi:hypothetical protein